MAEASTPRPTRRRRRPGFITALVLAISLLLGLGGLTACGHQKAGSTASGTTASAPANPTATPSGCPTQNTRKWAKTRFGIDVGSAAYAVHHWVYKPAKSHAFAKGAPKRFRTYLKAGAASLFAAHQLKNAKLNIQANPTLCKASKKFYASTVGKLSDTFSNLTTKLKKGQASEKDITDANQQLSSFESGNGIKDVVVQNLTS
jgi:hypothetical protein